MNLSVNQSKSQSMSPSIDRSIHEYVNRPINKSRDPQCFPRRSRGEHWWDLDIRLKCSVIGKHVITDGWSCSARKPLPSDITSQHEIANLNTSEISRERYSQEYWFGCAARLQEALPYIWPKSAIFSTLFMTWEKIWISYIYDRWGWYSYSKHRLWCLFLRFYR